MSSVFDSPYFYISIFSTTCFIISETLPFLQIKTKGILHTILYYLNIHNKQDLNKIVKNNSSQTEDDDELVYENVI
jgi:hypothetical protein